jgi:membrane protein
MSRLKQLFELLRDTFNEFNRDKVPRLAAALAYYTAFSVAPLIIVVIAIAGLAFGQEAVRGQLDNQIQGLVGAQAADAIQQMVASANQPETGTIASIIGVVTLLLGAGGLFGQLQDALNTVWGVEPKPNQGIIATIRARFLSFTMVLGIGFLLLVSLVVSAGLSALNTWMSGLLPIPGFILQLINFVISFAVVTLLFMMIFRILPDVDIAWRDVSLGAAVTALLFVIGKFLIGLYLGNSSVASSYGAAGSFVVFLLWVYYSAQILLFGAEFTQVFAKQYGSKIVPSEHAQFVSDEERAQQGMKPKDRAGQKASTRERQPAPAVDRQIAAQQSRVVASPQPAVKREGNLAAVVVGIMAALASFLVGLLIRNEDRR